MLKIQNLMPGVVCAAAAAVALVGGFAATPASAQNGVGPDPDGDGNPATDVYGFYREAAPGADQFDLPFEVVTFDPPPGGNNDIITGQYADGPGVRFSDGLKLQVCDGPRYAKYDSRCVYEAPPSGRFAAVYTAAPAKPLRISFAEPVCATALSIYPVGGAEGERFQVTMTLLRSTTDGARATQVGSAKVDFTWTNNTFRWRNKVMAFLENGAADAVEIEMRSFRHEDADAEAKAQYDHIVASGEEPPQMTEAQKAERAERRRRNIDFLIDDVAFISADGELGVTTCKSVLASIAGAD